VTLSRLSFSFVFSLFLWLFLSGSFCLAFDAIFLSLVLSLSFYRSISFISRATKRRENDIIRQKEGHHLAERRERERNLKRITEIEFPRKERKINKDNKQSDHLIRERKAKEQKDKKKFKKYPLEL
jgi:predicted membrane protein